MTLTDAVAGEVRANLARKGKAKQDLAKVLGCSSHHLSKLVAGNRPMTTDQIELTANFLGMSYRDLFPQCPESAAVDVVEVAA